MKRLRFYLLNSEKRHSTSLHAMYDAKMLIPEQYRMLESGRTKDIASQELRDNVYWHDDIGYRVTMTSRVDLDLPTVTVLIPLSKLAIVSQSVVSADFILRALLPYISALNDEISNAKRQASENGMYYCHVPDNRVLHRNAVSFGEELTRYYEYVKGGEDGVYEITEMDVQNATDIYVKIMLQVQLPIGKYRKMIQMLTKDLPDAIKRFITDFDSAALDRALALFEKQNAIREHLRNSDYCAFLANGSILPRSEGGGPLDNAVPFVSPKHAEVEFSGVVGMGIKRGVTVITGGGYSGKSTLLDSIYAGVHNHIAGDGRELIITDETAVSIAAEDGRCVSNVNISPFIQWLPAGDVKDFTTTHASGSTSQAANIIEAINGGASLLLIDEDKSATNFMIRDKMMRRIIAREPIIPFTDRVNELYSETNVSTILVIGGSGEYLGIADSVYLMDNYEIQDITQLAGAVYDELCEASPKPITADWQDHRVLLGNTLTTFPKGATSELLQVYEMGLINMGNEAIDMRWMLNDISYAQLSGIAFILRALVLAMRNREISLIPLIDEIYDGIENDGVDSLYSPFFKDCARFIELPRRCEVFATVNRMRNVRFTQSI